MALARKPSDRVKVLIKKYGPEGTHLKEQEAAVAQYKAPKTVPDPGEPAVIATKPKNAEEAAASSEGAEAPAESGVETAPAAE